MSQNVPLTVGLSDDHDGIVETESARPLSLSSEDLFQICLRAKKIAEARKESAASDEPADDIGTLGMDRPPAESRAAPSSAAVDVRSASRNLDARDSGPRVRCSGTGTGSGTVPPPGAHSGSVCASFGPSSACYSPESCSFPAAERGFELLKAIHPRSEVYAGVIFETPSFSTLEGLARRIPFSHPSHFSQVRTSSD